jgi:hypothetical protein
VALLVVEKDRVIVIRNCVALQNGHEFKLDIETSFQVSLVSLYAAMINFKNSTFCPKNNKMKVKVKVTLRH